MLIGNPELTTHTIGKKKRPRVSEGKTNSFGTELVSVRHSVRSM